MMWVKIPTNSQMTRVVIGIHINKGQYSNFAKNNILETGQIQIRSNKG